MNFSVLDLLPQPFIDGITNVMEWLMNTATGADTWVQILVMMLGGAIPFIESYGAAFFGVVLGLPPILAVVAAVIGNIACMLVLAALAGGARDVATRGRTKDEGKPMSKRRRRMAMFFDRMGVPGVCLLTPLALPTMFTAPILVGMGARRVTVYVWMTISIIAWGVVFGFFGEWAHSVFM